MSAYKEFNEIQLANAACLVEALRQLGYTPEFGRSLVLYGYEGDARREAAQIVVRRSQIGSSSNDLGFAWNGKAFIPVISEFDARNALDEEWRQQLQTMYGKMAVLRFLQAKGARIQKISTGDLGIHVRATVEVQP